MGLEITSVNWMLDQLATKLALIRLYDASDIEILDHEGESQDQPALWSPAADGALVLASGVRFEIPAGTTPAKIAFLDAVAFGEWASHTIAPEQRESYANNGLFDVTAANATITIGE